MWRNSPRSAYLPFVSLPQSLTRKIKKRLLSLTLLLLSRLCYGTALHSASWWPFYNLLFWPELLREVPRPRLPLVQVQLARLMLKVKLARVETLRAFVGALEYTMFDAPGHLDRALVLITDIYWRQKPRPLVRQCIHISYPQSFRLSLILLSHLLQFLLEFRRVQGNFTRLTYPFHLLIAHYFSVSTLCQGQATQWLYCMLI